MPKNARVCKDQEPPNPKLKVLKGIPLGWSQKQKKNNDKIDNYSCLNSAWYLKNVKLVKLKSFELEFWIKLSNSKPSIHNGFKSNYKLDTFKISFLKLP